MNLFVQLTGWLSQGQPDPHQSKRFMFMCLSLPATVRLSKRRFGKNGFVKTPEMALKHSLKFCPIFQCLVQKVLLSCACDGQYLLKF